MRIVVHGQQAFGETVLKRLLERDENVVAVCTAPDKEGRPVDPLKALALENDIPVYQPASWKTDESLTLMKSFDADICMMAYVLLFVPEAALNAPKHGTFQYHPSLLPMHRGPSSINWPIATGATRTGLTIFWPDDGLDEGPILLQKECRIGPDETLGDVYFKKLFPMGVDAMIESLDRVKAGTAPKIIQDLSKGTYESWFGKEQSRVYWQQSAQQCYNIIRASNPQPGAWITHNGNTLKIYDAGVSTETGQPGTVLSISDEGILVAAGDGSVLIKRVRADAGKVSASEYAASMALAAGEQFG